MRPIVTTLEMIDLEHTYVTQGGDTAALMHEVASQAAALISALSPSSCFIVAGVGNNGADALLTGCYLLQQNIACTAWCIGPAKPNSLQAKQKERFFNLGGSCIETLPPSLHDFDCCIDGLFGIGFSGALSLEAKTAINWLNQQQAPIYSIDIPSGLDATSGTFESCAVKAQVTLTCHLPKWGLFLNHGFEHTGHLITLPLSLPLPENPYFFLLEQEDIAQRMPKILRTRDKYNAGAVVGVAGSLEMSGASLLASEAALRIGAGIMRLFTPKEAFTATALREIIRIPIEEMDNSNWTDTLKHADSAFIGPGLGRSKCAESIVSHFLPLLPQKKVIDGDGLYYGKLYPEQFKNALLTPHKGEMSKLLGKLIGEKISLVTLNLIHLLKKWVMDHECTLILKGGPSYIFSSNGSCFVMPEGDPGMATAGSGDVLTGILAGLLAQKLEPIDAAIVGSWLHGRAGEKAAEYLTSYSLLASDLINALPEAIFEIKGV